MIKNNCYILTGAPGTGKSSLLNELSNTCQVVEEPARRIIAEQRSMNGTALWEKDRDGFINLLLEYSLLNFQRNAGTNITFFDRGIPDCIAYAHSGNVETQSLYVVANQFRYNPKIFLLLPWKDIYQNDSERTMSYEATLSFHDYIVSAYTDLGYELVRVPKLDVRARSNFILNEIIG